MCNQNKQNSRARTSPSAPAAPITDKVSAQHGRAPGTASQMVLPEHWDATAAWEGGAPRKATAMPICDA